MNADAEPSRQEVQGVSAIQAPDSELAKFNAEMVALGEAEGYCTSLQSMISSINFVSDCGY